MPKTFLFKISHASMAKTPNSKSKPHLFLSCFGFSGKFRRFKPLKPAAGHKKRPSFSWMKFHSNPPPAVGFPAEKNRSNPDSCRLSFTSISPTATCKSSIEDFSGEEVKNGIVAQKIIFESCKHSDSPKKLADQSQSRFSLTRKLDSFRSSRFAQPASPTVEKSLKSTAISHSLPFPPPNPTRTSSRVNEPLASMRVRSKTGKSSKKNQPVMGMSILIMILAIMVLWGKLCAILCTAIWIFIVTSLRSIIDEDDAIQFFESDSYSQGFKNKLVILKGFLYRNQRENLFKKL